MTISRCHFRRRGTKNAENSFRSSGLNRLVCFNRADLLRLLSCLVVSGLLYVSGVCQPIGTIFAAEPHHLAAPAFEGATVEGSAVVRSDWSVYRDAQFGFSLRYPGDWTLSPGETVDPYAWVWEVRVIAPSGVYAAIVVDVSPLEDSHQDLESWAAAVLAARGYSWAELEAQRGIQPVLIDEVPALRIELPADSEILTVFTHGEYGYVISLDQGDADRRTGERLTPELRDQNAAIYDEVVGSWVFGDMQPSIEARTPSLTVGVAEVADAFDFPVGARSTFEYAENPYFWEGQYHYCFGTDKGNLYHGGQDRDNLAGTAVRAVANGEVYWYDPYYSSYPGRIVIVEHDLTGGGTIFSMYAHLGSVSVSAGQSVQKGDLIGTLLDQGSNTHIHWEMRYNGSMASFPCNSGFVPGIGYTYPNLPDAWGYTNPPVFVIAQNGGTCPAPYPLDPEDGSILDSRTVTFRWNGEKWCDFEGYTFRVCTSSDVSNPANCLIDTDEAGTQRIETIRGYDNQDLYWGVRAANAPHGADWAVSRFRIEPETPPPPSGQWTARYFSSRTCWDNHSLCTNPGITETLYLPGEAVLLDEDWGTGDPGGVGVDDWTGLFEATLDFSSGDYVFYADHDDGLKLEIGAFAEHTKDNAGNGSKICNGTGGYALSGEVPITAYLREDGGEARLRLWWSTNTGDCLPPPPVAPILQSPDDAHLYNEGQDITLAWSDTGDAYYGEIWGGPEGTQGFGWHSDTFENTGSPMAGYTYSWHVKGRNVAGLGEWSSTWTFTVKPAAPSELSALAMSSARVDLSWSDNSGHEAGYELFRNGSYLAGVGANTTGYQDTSVSGGTTYTYTVEAFRGSIRSGASNMVQVTTPAGGDAYEPDDGSGQAGWITTGSPQLHSILPAADVDWVKFSLDSESEVVLECSGTSGDTRMWLYDDSLSQLAWDDNGGSGEFSRIDRLCDVDALPSGTYYVKLDEKDNDDEISGYTLSLTAGLCAATPVTSTVVINEVYPGDPDWVELYNGGDAPVDVAGWHLVMYSGYGVVDRDFTLPALVLQPDAYVVVHETPGTDTVTDLYLDSNLSWYHGGSGAVALTGGTGSGFDFVRWGSSTVHPPSGTAWSGSDPSSPGLGRALGRLSSGDTNDGSDWMTLSPSPGGSNPAADVYLPVVVKGG